MTNISLPETVIALQRLDLLPETRQVVEEAARLLQDGREMEARALVEKAEALAAQASSGKRKGDDNRNDDTRGAGAMLAPIAEKLATGFTAVLTRVLEDIYHHTGDQVQVVASVLEERIHGIEEALHKTNSFEERLEQLAVEHQSLGHASLETRLAAVEERVTGIDQTVRDLQPQVTTVLTRMDRQADALRSLEQRQAQRVSALNQVLDNLSRLREEEPAPENSLPLM